MQPSINQAPGWSIACMDMRRQRFDGWQPPFMVGKGPMYRSCGSDSDATADRVLGSLFGSLFGIRIRRMGPLLGP